MTASTTPEVNGSSAPGTPARPGKIRKHDKLNKIQKEVLYSKSQVDIEKLLSDGNYAKTVYPLGRILINLNGLGGGGGGPEGLISGIAKTINDLGESKLLPELLQYREGGSNSKQARFVVPARELDKYKLTSTTRKALYNILREGKRIDAIHHNQLDPIVTYLNNFSNDSFLRYTTWLEYLQKSVPQALRAIDPFCMEYLPNADGCRIVEHPETKRMVQVDRVKLEQEGWKDAQDKVEDGMNGWMRLPPPIFQVYKENGPMKGYRMMAVMDTERLVNLFQIKLLEAAVAKGGVKELPATPTREVGFKMVNLIKNMGSRTYLGCLVKLRRKFPGIALTG